MSQVSSANRGSPDCTICDYGTARRPGPWASIFAVQTDVENKRVGLVSQVRSQLLTRLRRTTNDENLGFQPGLGINGLPGFSGENGNPAIESNEPVNTTGTKF
jgi:hypothetical protein